MAIAYDNSAFGTGAAGPTPQTFSLTVSSSPNRIFFVGVIGDTATDNITGATYAGVPMTLVSKVQVPGDRWNYLFYLLAPTSGTNNVVVSGTGTGLIIPAAVSYTGVAQTTLNATNTVTGSGTTLSNTVTTTVPNCWTISTFRSASTVTPTGITFNRIFYQAGTTAGMADSNSPVATGSTSLGETSSLTSWAMIMASFAPFVVNTSNGFFNFRKK